MVQFKNVVHSQFFFFRWELSEIIKEHSWQQQNNKKDTEGFLKNMDIPFVFKIEPKNKKKKVEHQQEK